MLALHLAFLALLVGTESLFALLDVLNVRHARRTLEAEASWVAEHLDHGDAGRLLDYLRTRTGLARLRSVTGLAVVLLVLYSGLLADAVAAVEATGWHPVARGVAFAVAAALAARAWGLPFDAVDALVVEEAFGFNRRTPRLWVRDRAVTLVVAVLVVALLAAAVLAALHVLPGRWWLVAWAVVVGFALAALVVYPRVLAPLFNDFEPVESGDLREAVDEVFDRAGFSCEQVYVMDASRRSGHSNAYFVGFGRTKRVVLFDTLVDQLSTAQLQAVLAHELAHWKQAHVWKRIAAAVGLAGVALFALQALVAAPWPYAMFGLPETAGYAGLAVGLLWVLPVFRLASPLVNRLSLRHEREADAFAVAVLGDGDPLAGALRRLTDENLANPFPHPAYAAFHYTHPPVPERIRAIRGMDAGDG